MLVNAYNKNNEDNAAVVEVAKAEAVERGGKLDRDEREEGVLEDVARCGVL